MSRRIPVISPLTEFLCTEAGGGVAGYRTCRTGIHPTIAGVALGLLSLSRPMGGKEGRLALRTAVSSGLTWAGGLGLIGKMVGITGVTWLGPGACRRGSA